MIAFVAANLAHTVGPERDAHMLLVAGTGAPLARLLRQQGQACVTLDEDAQDPALTADAALSAGALLAHPRIRRALAEHGCRAVLPFKTSSALERAAAELGVPVLAAPSRLTRQLENKLQLPAIAAGAGVQAARSEQVQLDQRLVGRARSGELELPLVFQPPTGFAGAGTTIVRTPEDAAQLVEHAGGKAAIGKLVEYVAGDALTVTAVAFDDGEVLVGPVARQLIGSPHLSPAELGSCGNEWSVPVPGQITDRVRELAHCVGGELIRRGFIGAFGIDAVATAAGDSVLIEINPRWTASLSLQVQLQQRVGVPTLAEAHLAAFGQLAPSRRAQLQAAWHLEAQVPDLGPASSQIAYNCAARAVIPADVPVGAWDPGNWSYLGPATRLDELPRPTSVLVLPQPPTRPVAPGAELIRTAALAPAGDDTRWAQLPVPADESGHLLAGRGHSKA